MWCHSMSLHVCQPFNHICCTCASIFQWTEKSVGVSNLPNIKYRVTSHPFSKWINIRSITFYFVHQWYNKYFNIVRLYFVSQAMILLAKYLWSTKNYSKLVTGSKPTNCLLMLQRQIIWLWVLQKWPPW